MAGRTRRCAAALLAPLAPLAFVVTAPAVGADDFSPLRLPEVTATMLAEATHPLDAKSASHALEIAETPLETRVRSGNQLLVRLASDILFDFGSAEVKPSAAARLADLVSGLPRAAPVAVTGYTDSIGSTLDNLDLSRRRAEAVAALLRRARADLVLTVIGKGEADPVASNGMPGHDDPEGRAQNRRVELRYGG